jgi:hypothetical protein
MTEFLFHPNVEDQTAFQRISNSHLKGSDTGTDWADVSPTVTFNTVQSSWNKWKFPSDTKNDYRYWRFYGGKKSYCKLTEIGYKGERIFTSSAPDVTCDIVVSADGCASATL